MIDKIPIEPNKYQGEVDQLSYKGMPLHPAVQATILKVNELIDMANELIGVGLAGITGTNAIGCCTEEKEHD